MVVSGEVVSKRSRRQSSRIYREFAQTNHTLPLPAAGLRTARGLSIYPSVGGPMLVVVV